MGIVKAGYKFLRASVGLPVSVNDACTFQASYLYEGIVNGRMLPDIRKNTIII